MEKKIFLLVGFILVAAVVGFILPAQAAEEVTVYSSNMQALNDLAAAEFQKVTGIKVNMVRAPSGVALKRMRAEKDNPQGDIFWGISKVVLMANQDLLEPYKSVHFDLIPPEYRDPQYHWIGTNLQILVLMYNKDLVKDAEVPKKWNDLLNPKWKNKVAFPNPANSSFAFTTFTLMLHMYGNNEAAWKKMETFLGNMQVVEQSSMVPTSLEKGEFHVGVTQEYVATRYVAGGAKVGLVYPEEGNSIQAEGAGILKGAKHRKAAEKFVDFCNDKNFREWVIKDQFRRPARKDLDFSKIVPMAPLSQIKLMPGYVDTNYLGDRDKILARIKDILLRIK
ncbi:MAG: extracellular solute-binding protein [Pseudomonadota bacterium]